MTSSPGPIRSPRVPGCRPAVAEFTAIDCTPPPNQAEKSDSELFALGVRCHPTGAQTVSDFRNFFFADLGSANGRNDVSVMAGLRVIVTGGSLGAWSHMTTQYYEIKDASQIACAIGESAQGGSRRARYGNSRQERLRLCRAETPD